MSSNVAIGVIFVILWSSSRTLILRWFSISPKKSSNDRPLAAVTKVVFSWIYSWGSWDPPFALQGTSSGNNAIVNSDRGSIGLCQMMQGQMAKAIAQELNIQQNNVAAPRQVRVVGQ